MIWYIYNFPDDPSGFRLRGRLYRSEADILAVILRILEAADKPVRKTRLIQYANLNTRSFSKYMTLLVEGGLVYPGKGGYTITRKGRTALSLLDALLTLLTPPPSGLEKTVEALCSQARQRGWACTPKSDGFDILIDAGDTRVGVYILSCTTPAPLPLMATLLAATTPKDIKTALLCTGCTQGSPGPLTPPTTTPLAYRLCKPDDNEIQDFLHTLATQHIKNPDNP